MTWASVVLPEPGGPQRISERSSSSSRARRSGRPGPSGCVLAERARRACADACGRPAERRRPARRPGLRAARPPERAYPGQASVGRTGTAPELIDRDAGPHDSAIPVATATFGSLDQARRCRAASKSGCPRPPRVEAFHGAASGIERRRPRAPPRPRAGPRPRCREQRQGPAQVGPVVGACRPCATVAGGAGRACGRDRGPSGRCVRAGEAGGTRCPWSRGGPSRRRHRRSPRRRMAPVAPAASAVRRRPPRLPGILHGDRDHDEGRPREDPASSSNRGRSAIARSPWLVSASENEGASRSRERGREPERPRPASGRRACAPPQGVRSAREARPRPRTDRAPRPRPRASSDQQSGAPRGGQVSRRGPSSRRPAKRARTRGLLRLTDSGSCVGHPRGRA